MKYLRTLDIKKILYLNIFILSLVAINVGFQELNPGQNKLFYFSSLFDDTYSEVTKSIENNDYPVEISYSYLLRDNVDIRNFKQKTENVNKTLLFIKIAILTLLSIILLVILYFLYNISKVILLNDNNSKGLVKIIRAEGVLILLFSVLHISYMNINALIAHELIECSGNIIMESIKQSPLVLVSGPIIILFSAILSNSDC